MLNDTTIWYELHMNTWNTMKKITIEIKQRVYSTKARKHCFSHNRKLGAWSRTAQNVSCVSWIWPSEGDTTSPNIHLACVGVFLYLRSDFVRIYLLSVLLLNPLTSKCSGTFKQRGSKSTKLNELYWIWSYFYRALSDGFDCTLSESPGPPCCLPWGL